MPLFYFDLHGGGRNSVRDQEGTRFETHLDAQAHAMTLLPVMGIEMPLREGEFRTWTATVRDEGGETVCRFILAIISDQIGPEGVRRLQAAARG